MDLTGRRFGKLIVVAKSDRRKNRAVLWECRCDCGNLVYKPTHQLNSGNARSCGCAWRQPAVREGERFGRLTAIRPTQMRRSTNVVWECRCDCGNILTVRSALLSSGHTTSCGCRKKEIDAQRDFKDVLTFQDDTCIEFARNISCPVANTSSETGTRGVTMMKNGRYRAQLTFRKVRYSLGCYRQLEDAVEARRKAEAMVAEWLEDHDQLQACEV